MKTLVLGASLDPQRYAYLALERLTAAQIPVVAIGKQEGELVGVQITTQKVFWEDIHTVTLYLNPFNQREYYDYILTLRPKRVIFNPGTENPELYRLLDQAGIAYVEACTLVLLSLNQYHQA
jgi:predicted CoA-binding protein